MPPASLTASIAPGWKGVPTINPGQNRKTGTDLFSVFISCNRQNRDRFIFRIYFLNACRRTSRAPRLSGYGAYFRGEFAQDQFLELNLLAGIINVNADQVTLGVVIEYDAFGNLAAIRAGFFSQIDVERIGIRVVFQFHGLNPLS